MPGSNSPALASDGIEVGQPPLVMPAGRPLPDIISTVSAFSTRPWGPSPSFRNIRMNFM